MKSLSEVLQDMDFPTEDEKKEYLLDQPYGALPLKRESEQGELPTWNSRYLPTKEYCPSDVVDPNSLPNIQRIKAWISECSCSHGSSCNPPANASTDEGPKWLLDLESECIAPAMSGSIYAVLSYVWGKDHEQPFRALKSNIESLQKSGALTMLLHSGSLANRQPELIAHTICDAVATARILGFRFLWVDTLCIVQDDILHLETEISKMGAIYSGASLTLVAAQGESSTHGLHFVSYPDPKYYKGPDIFGFSDSLPYKGPESMDPPSGRHYAPRNVLRDSVWATRGWTMQELLFSKRVLFFTAQGPIWECGLTSATLVSSTAITREIQDGTDASRSFHTTQWPDFDLYAGIIADYNRRKLTYDEDVIRAVAAVTLSLEKAFTAGFIFGLPVIFFHWALLWDTEWEHGVRKSPTLKLPSWSWMSTRGEMDLRLYPSACDYLLKSNQITRFLDARQSLMIRSIVEIQLEVRDGETTKLIPLPSMYDTHRAIAKQPAGNLPANWTRTPEGSFQHTSDRYSEFAFPLPDYSEVPRVTSASISPHLHFRAKRGFFHIDRPSIHDISHLRCWIPTTSVLHDPHGKPVGVLKLHTEKFFDLWRLDRYLHREHHLADVIGISEGSIVLSEDEERFKDEAKVLGLSRGETYRFVNILYIRWSEGIAYRESLGRILKHAWDDAIFEEIDVVLG